MRWPYTLSVYKNAVTAVTRVTNYTSHGIIALYCLCCLTLLQSNGQADRDVHCEERETSIKFTVCIHAHNYYYTNNIQLKCQSLRLTDAYYKIHYMFRLMKDWHTIINYFSSSWQNVKVWHSCSRQWMKCTKQ